MTVYLDYASSTPTSEAVLEAFLQAERAYIGNPMSTHGVGEKARDELSRVTGSIADMLGVSPPEIIFTSGATEANNLAIKGIAHTYKYQGRHILSTCLEHPSVSGTLTALQNAGYEIELLKILPDGTIDLAYLESAIRADTILVCVSTVDSELGAIQPIVEISKIVGGRHLHVDAAQAMGKIPVEIAGASTLSFSPHKFYGLCGSGILVKRDGVVLEPQIHGGRSTTIYRSGTPTLSLAAACEKALELVLSNQAEWLAKVTNLKSYLLNGLRDRVRINSTATGSPYILNLSVKGIKATQIVAELSRRGICVSAKSACSTDNSPSRPVMAITRDKQNALSSWRISLSHLTKTAELDILLSAIKDISI